MICLSPVILLLASLLWGRSLPDRGPSWSLALGAVATALAGLNFYLSFIRGRRFKARHGSLEGYRHVSGIPAIGTLLVVIAGITGFGQTETALVGLAAMLLDTGGSLWFVVQTWRDTSFWDK